MPVTLPPISRRQFLSISTATAAAWLLGFPRLARAQSQTDPNRFALISDTHIHADRQMTHQSGTQPWKNLQQVTSEIGALSPRPAAVMVCGDCVYLQGHAEDYATVLAAMAPLREAGLPVHLLVGNHDDRQSLWKVLPDDEARHPDWPDRQIMVLPSPHANWYLLDTLKITDRTAGFLGQRQLAWLASSLDARPDRPALLMFHHDPKGNPDQSGKAGGLEDSNELMDIILPRKQVKACIFGHTHVWNYAQHDGLHLVNLPPHRLDHAPQKTARLGRCPPPPHRGNLPAHRPGSQPPAKRRTTRSYLAMNHRG